MAYQIMKDLCTACGDCEPVCPTDSIGPAKGVYAINTETCNECDGESDMPQCIDACMEDGCIVPV